MILAIQNTSAHTNTMLLCFSKFPRYKGLKFKRKPFFSWEWKLNYRNKCKDIEIITLQFKPHHY